MKVAYLLHEFPCLSQTFIKSEVEDHIDAGLNVDIFSLTSSDRLSASLDRNDLATSRVQYLEKKCPTAMGIISAALADPFHKARGLSAAVRLDCATLWERLAAFRLASAWRGVQDSYDIVHCHFGNYGHRAAALKASGQIKGHLVVSFHGADLSRDRGRSLVDYYRQLFSVGACFLPVSNFWAEKLIEIGCPREKIVVQHMGVDVAGLTARKPLLPHDDVRIASIGRCIEKKGQAFVIRAIAQVRKRRADLRIVLDVVGDGPLLDSLRNLAASLDVSDVVKFHGALPHASVLDILSTCDLVVLPSITASNGDKEGIPVVLMEAMAMQLPVLSTYHSGIPELVEHQISGLLAAERDVDALSINLERAATDAMLRSKLGNEAKKKVLAEFDVRQLGIRLRSLYERLVEGKSLSLNIGW